MTEQWSYNEVAAHLGVAASTVRKYGSAGRLPPPDGRVANSPWWRLLDLVTLRKRTAFARRTVIAGQAYFICSR